MLHKTVRQAQTPDTLAAQQSVIIEEFQNRRGKASGQRAFFHNQQAVKTPGQIRQLLFRQGLEPDRVFSQ